MQRGCYSRSCFRIWVSLSPSSPTQSKKVEDCHEYFQMTKKIQTSCSIFPLFLVENQSQTLTTNTSRTGNEHLSNNLTRSLAESRFDYFCMDFVTNFRSCFHDCITRYFTRFSWLIWITNSRDPCRYHFVAMKIPKISYVLSKHRKFSARNFPGTECNLNFQGLSSVFKKSLCLPQN